MKNFSIFGNVCFEMKKIFLFLKKYREVVVLTVIFSVGIFLRAYSFHDWLLFELDQVRDAVMIDRVLDGTEKLPLLGPTMRGSGETKEMLFRVGPMYSYFQIFSAKIFDSRPDAAAYPDLLFSILSIPLLFLFLKRYFVSNVSLALTGLYSISFFSIQYSRFAWNPNSIPFFVLLFLISLHEFFWKREKAGVGYGVALGIALGIGVQLHAIALVVLLGTMLISTFFLLKRNLKMVKKLLIVFGIAFLLNGPQIFSEVNTGFSNTKAFFSSPAKEGKGSVFGGSNIADTIVCHVESNVFIVASLGVDSCEVSVKKLSESKSKETFFRRFVDYFSKSSFILGVFLSFFGFIFLVRRWRLEEDTGKKAFLIVVFLFFLVSFLSMLTVISSGFREFRYFSILFFLPFVLLGGILEFFLRARSIYVSTVFLVLTGTFFFFANFLALRNVASELLAGEGNDGHSVYLGEVDQLVEYVVKESDGKHEANLLGKTDFLKNIFRPMEYVASHRGFVLKKVEKEDYVLTEDPSFYISRISKDDRKKSSLEFTEDIGGFQAESCRIFGKILLCKIVHP